MAKARLPVRKLRDVLRLRAAGLMRWPPPEVAKRDEPEPARGRLTKVWGRDMFRKATQPPSPVRLRADRWFRTMTN
jgi:hypothetical protein